MNEFRVLSPTAILGYGYPLTSFMEGIKRAPDLIAVDAGSTDPGPYYLGSGKAFTNRIGVKRDLRAMLKEGVTRKIPVVIGTAGGSGAEPHLAWCRDIVLELAKEEGLSFRLATIRSDVPKSVVHTALAEGRITPLTNVPPLTNEDIDEATNVVAQIGIAPIIEALEGGADVVLAGRAYDPAVFAALPVMKGYDKGLAFHMGKILECAAIAATPGSGSDSVMGVLDETGFTLEPLSDARTFTTQSVAAHTLYEKSDPYHLPGPGGLINLEACSFTELDGGRVRVTGSRFEESEDQTVKLEAARAIGFRSISIAGTRDPIMIQAIDGIIDAVNMQVRDILKDEGMEGDVFFHIYGKNGVMGSMEPLRETKAHELAILIEVVAKTQDVADTIVSITRSTMLHYGYKGRISTAGNLAFPFSPSDISTGAVYTFCIYHVLTLADETLFPVTYETVS